MLKRHAIQVLRAVGHGQGDIARLTDVLIRRVRREGEPDICCGFSSQLKPEKMAPSEKRGSHEENQFTEEEMVTILREADQRPVPEMAKKHAGSDQTIYAWRNRFGTWNPADVKRLRQLEQQNGRLKRWSRIASSRSRS